MGLWSKVKKGFKKVVSKVARGIKKVAKSVVTALPGGKWLWEKTGELGKKAMKGIAKLGPVGMIAIQVLLSVTGIGAAVSGMLGSMWSGFGAASAAAAASTNVLVSAMGTAGSGLFAAGNFVAGTLGAMGNAISEGASQLMNGNFSAAASTFGQNMGSALSGEAGMASVNSAAAQAAQQAGTLIGDSLNAADAVAQGVDANFAAENLGTDATGFDPSSAGEFSIEDIADVTSNQTAGLDPAAAYQPDNILSLEEMAQKEITGKAGALTLKETGVLIDHGKAGVDALQPGSVNVADQNQQTLKDGYELANKVTDYFGSSAEQSGGSGQSLIQRPASTQAIGSANVGGGRGSEGFSLLKGVQGLEQSLRNSQNLMFT